MLHTVPTFNIIITDNSADAKHFPCASPNFFLYFRPCETPVKHGNPFLKRKFDHTLQMAYRVRRAYHAQKATVLILAEMAGGAIIGRRGEAGTGIRKILKSGNYNGIEGIFCEVGGK